jgi:hypothetical protein
MKRKRFMEEQIIAVLRMNYCAVDRMHPSCSKDFLDERNREYGGHWWRVAGLLVLMVVLGQTEEFTRDIMISLLSR